MINWSNRRMELGLGVGLMTRGIVWETLIADGIRGGTGSDRLT